MRAPLLALMLVPVAAVAASDGAMSETEAQALCARFEHRAGVPVATEADRSEFASTSFCGDYLYELVGDEYDPDKARRCCLVKGDCNREIAIVYANGWGVARDFDLATYFLCRAGDEMAPFEQWSMLAHVERMRDGSEDGELKYCDHVTSGRGGLFCEQLRGNEAASEQATRIAVVSRDFDAATRDAATRLQSGANAYADAEGTWEADGSRGGTAYASFVVAAQNAALAAHVDRFEQRAKARAPRADAAALAASDAALNRAYKLAMDSDETCPLCNEGDHEGRRLLRDAQRAWIVYRDAFARFYCARWRAEDGAEELKREIVAELSKSRADELERLAKGE